MEAGAAPVLSRPVRRLDNFRVVVGSLLLSIPSQMLPIVLAAQALPGRSDTSTNTLSLPLTLQSHVGDLDAMVERHEIRVLVVFSR